MDSSKPKGWVRDIGTEGGPKQPSFAMYIVVSFIIAFVGAFAARFGWAFAGRFVP